MSAPLLFWRQLGYQDSAGNVLLKPSSSRIDAGDRIVLQGGSGSGKSLLLRSLARLNQYHCQSLQLNGQAHSKLSVRQWRQQVALVAQQAVMINGSVEDNLRLPYTFKNYHHQTFDKQKIINILTAFGKPKAFIARDINRLSGGERQIVNLLRTLQLSPDILLLDEPTAALDSVSRDRLQQLLLDWVAETGKQRAFLWISHDKEQARRIATCHWQMQAGGQLITDKEANHAG